MIEERLVALRHNLPLVLVRDALLPGRASLGRESAANLGEGASPIAARNLGGDVSLEMTRIQHSVFCFVVVSPNSFVFCLVVVEQPTLPVLVVSRCSIVTFF